MLELFYRIGGPDQTFVAEVRGTRPAKLLEIAQIKAESWLHIFLNLFEQAPFSGFVIFD